MEEIKVNEEIRESLAKEYPRKSLFLDPVAIYGFLTVWSIVGWFLAGTVILLNIGSKNPMPALMIPAFLVCVALTVVFGIFTAKHARIQKQAHSRGE